MTTVYDEDQISAERSREFDKHLPIGIIATLVNSLILAFILWNTTAHSTMVIWCGAMIIVSALRCISLYKYRPCDH